MAGKNIKLNLRESNIVITYINTCFNAHEDQIVQQSAFMDILKGFKPFSNALFLSFLV